MALTIFLPRDQDTVPIQMAYNDLTVRFDYNASGNLLYAGKSLPGANSASAVWQIKKFQYDTAANDNLSSILLASGTLNFDQIWDDRAGLNFL